MNALVPKIYYEFNTEIPIGTKVKFLKNLEPPTCRAYDPNLAGTIGTIVKVGSRRIYVEYKDSHGWDCTICIEPHYIDLIEIEGFEIKYTGE